MPTTSPQMTSSTHHPPVHMPIPAVQGESASLDSKGVPLFVSPEKDMFAKPGSDQDSWFWVANLETKLGTLNLLVHFLGIAAVSEQGMLGAMVSVLNPQTRKYVSEEQDFPIAQCSLASDKFEIISPIATVVGDGTSSHVTGTWDEIGVSVDLTFTKAGPLLANVGNGLFALLGDVNYHYAFPTMNATGTITIDGETYEASGPSWLDRQWGVTPRFFTDTPKSGSGSGSCWTTGIGSACGT